MTTVYFSLGSNLGDRASNLRQAVSGLAEWLQDIQISAIYETAPWGLTEQPAFFNICLSGDTSLTPTDLLRRIKALELQIGREPAVRWGPRLIDIDILIYGETVLHSEELTIPHPRLAERGFVLVPLAEIAPHLRHPLTDRSVAELLAAVDASDVVKLVRLDDAQLEQPGEAA